ncbi:MAG: efflux transporter periplasmic adaptor subunit [Oleispira sp.]|nr:efflux transporter periplasmic adaptor subunit [Oleispira sp.]
MKLLSPTAVVTVVAILCIGLAVAYNGHKMAEKNASPKPKVAKVSAPSVSVVQVFPNTYQAYVNSHGEAKAHWALTLKAQVEGEVTSLTNVFKTGSIVTKGTVLGNIDNTEYLQAIASAKVSLADAQLGLQEEKDLGEQARREWKRSGVTEDPSSPLVFRTLQLVAAQAAENNAEYSLKTALRDEKNTEIGAPFDAVILSRDIDLGSYVSVGDTLATLNSSDKIEVFVPLALSQFETLNPNLSGEVVLSDISTGMQWTGYIDRVENHLDTSSRQRNVVVAVDKPFEQTTPLLPGTFLSIEIAGKVLNKVLKVPASAVSQDGQIWYVDENNTLVSVIANKIFERDGFVYLTPIEGSDVSNIVVRPLVSYLNGMLVSPVVEE